MKRKRVRECVCAFVQERERERMLLRGVCTIECVRRTYLGRYEMQGEEANVLVVEILIKICTAANIRKLIELAILKCAHRA